MALSTGTLLLNLGYPSESGYFDPKTGKARRVEGAPRVRGTGGPVRPQEMSVLRPEAQGGSKR